MINKNILLLMAFVSSFITITKADTLDFVKERGSLLCGVTQGLPGFSYPSRDNKWSGLDVDFCRAISAVIFNDTNKVKFIPLSSKERFIALQSGEIDVLSRNTTKTMSRDISQGINFIGTTYYDGQGFMVRKDLGISNAKELNGAIVCANSGSTTELNMNDFFRLNNIRFKALVFEKKDEVISAYEAGRCDAVTSDISGLQAYRSKMKNPSTHLVLPNVISKEPLTPAVRNGDDRWLDIVSWTRNCLINAEELGIYSNNIKKFKNSSDPKIKRILGREGDFGKFIGLDDSWCANAIRLVGNYGEIYNRNLGDNAIITIDRGLNNLWNKGGIMYASPIR